MARVYQPQGAGPFPAVLLLHDHGARFDISYKAGLVYEHIDLNLDNPILKDKRVRHAIAHAIDRESIARDLLKGSRDAWGRLTPSGYPGYAGPTPVSFDPKRARECLARAGYPGGKGFPRISILFNTSEDHRRIADAISNDISLAAYMGELVAAAEDFELLAPVELSICCFRYVPPGWPTASRNTDLDQLNAAIMSRVQTSGRAYLSNATVNGHFALRACITNFRTTRSDIELTIETIRDAGLQEIRNIDVST